MASSKVTLCDGSEYTPNHCPFCKKNTPLKLVGIFEQKVIKHTYVMCTKCMACGPVAHVRILKADNAPIIMKKTLRAEEEAITRWGISSVNFDEKRREAQRNAGFGILVELEDKYLKDGYNARRCGVGRGENPGPTATMQANWDKGWSMANDDLPLPERFNAVENL